MMRKRNIAYYGGRIMALAPLLLFISLCGRQSQVQFRTVPLEKGDINVEVTASGTINPHYLIQVGTQVSGTISRILVDFNSRVKKDQLVALIDTTFLYAAVEDAAAAKNKALSQQVLTQNTAKRTKDLFDKGLAAQADLDQATADFESAKANLISAQAELDRAKINLAYARIVSPITGVVVNRNVDVGQTVAASFNTPTLFTIADDLTKMQVQASIDEADIGQIHTGQKAQFTVDAYPGRQYAGTVSQIRLQPTTVQNVVTYTVMIDVDNPDLSLLPGMTANITVSVQQAHDVFKVPAAALKFAPPGYQSPWAGKSGGRDSSSGTGHLKRSDSTHAGADGSGWKKSDSAASLWRHGNRQADSSAQKVNGGNAGNDDRKNWGRIFTLENGKPVRVPVRIGLSNGGFTAIEGNVQEGQAVITGMLTSSNNKPPSQPSTPFGMQAPPGGGMGRMR
ncbi:MAG: efflux RND transporter periplasmic adaptor subunit [Chitinivibrionales bacterium]